MFFVHLSFFFFFFFNYVLENVILNKEICWKKYKQTQSFRIGANIFHPGLVNTRKILVKKNIYKKRLLPIINT